MYWSCPPPDPVQAGDSTGDIRLTPDPYQAGDSTGDIRLTPDPDQAGDSTGDTLSDSVAAHHQSCQTVSKKLKIEHTVLKQTA